MNTREPKPKPGAPSTRVVIKPRAWEHVDPREVDLIPHQFGSNDWEVYLPDGTWIGTVGRYTGSLDRQIGRLRSPGKRRTLWSHTGTYEGARALHGQYSRADCIRDLLRAAARR